MIKLARTEKSCCTTPIFEKSAFEEPAFEEQGFKEPDFDNLICSQSITALLQRQAKDALVTPTPSFIAATLQLLINAHLAYLPLPGSGGTLQRWQALAEVAAHDLSLVKLFEGHVDAVAILAELGASVLAVPNSSWGIWAAEPPHAVVRIESVDGDRVRLSGRKAWCSGAAFVTHGLFTAWRHTGSGPQLVAVEMNQPGIRVVDNGWVAVGMAASSSLDVICDGAVGQLVGTERAYLERPGFWQGSAGVAACWHGGALQLARALRQSAMRGSAHVSTNAFNDTSDNASSAFKLAALGKVDLALQLSAGLLRNAAAWIDAHPTQDASAVALRTRLGTEQAAKLVLDEAGRALGATPFCQDARFARIAADLPVYLRQSHAERDFMALGERCLDGEPAWML